MIKSKLDNRVQEERLEILVQNLPTSLFTTAVVSIFLFFIVLDQVKNLYAVSWLSSILFLTFMRAFHLYIIKKRPKSHLGEEKKILLGIFLSGLFFSSSVLVIFPYNDFSTQILIFFIFSSLIAGSISLYSSHFFAFFIYSTPLLLAFLYRASTLHEMHIIIFFIGIFYYAVMITTMLRINRSIIEALKTQYLNQDLAQNLSNAKEELENSNQELQIENLSREETEKRLYRLANYDPLTGLPNRRMFKEALNLSIKNAKQKQSRLALLFLDLDNFKIINDTLGHIMGDKILIAASSRLKSLLDDKSHIARLGGDEFVIIINELDDVQEVSRLADKIISLIEKPFSFNEQEMFIGTSIGISLYPDDTQETQILLSYADTAMYSAKEKGKNNYQFFTSQMHDKIQYRHDIETKLHHAIENSEFHIVYQPKVDLNTQETVGAEALLRWNQKELGDISPSVFIPIAEESNLINQIGEWVISQVFEEISYMKKSFNNDLCISINVSSSQILHQNLVQIIQDNLDKYEIKAQCIELEFTENMLIKQGRKSLEVLQTLDKMGINLSIDDFGTGYSSLSYLKSLPIHTLKIDKSFITDTPHCDEDCAIAKSIISLADNLNLEVIAEGVENSEQIDFLKENGCSIIQGFYFSRPLDINAFSTYLNAPALTAQDRLNHEMSAVKV